MAVLIFDWKPLNMSIRPFDDLIKIGQIRPVRDGGLVLIDREDLDRWIDRKKTGSTSDSQTAHHKPSEDTIAVGIELFAAPQYGRPLGRVWYSMDTGVCRGISAFAVGHFKRSAPSRPRDRRIALYAR